MIDQLTIERILDAAPILDVVSQFVTLRKRGVNYVGLCPFHNEKTPSFYVSPSKGICKCFSCGKGGNAIHFVMEHEQMQYYQAAEWLAEKYGVPYQKRELTQEEKLRQDERESIFVVNEFARNWFREQLNTEKGKAIAMAYFRSRGFRDDTIEKFQLGYSPEQSDALARAALAKGFKPEFLVKSGVCYQRDDGQLRDRFWGRVIFPVHTISGKTVAFGGRVMKTDAKTAKYVNSPESSIYSKRRELYGLYFAKQAIVRLDRCFLVEGYADVISMFQSGVENVVASSGTSLTSGQIRLIQRFTSNITVLYDGDKAGIKASIRGIDMLLAEGMNVKVLLLPDGEDPDSFARGRSASAFQEYIEKNQVDFIRFKTRLLLDDAGDDPMRRAGLIKDITTSISVISDQITRSVYIKECSQLLQIDEKILIQEVNRLQADARAALYNKDKQNSVETDALPEEPAVPENAGENAQEAPQVDPVEQLRQEIRTLLKSDKAQIVQLEKLLSSMIVRYGDKLLCYTSYAGEDNYPMKVGEYIIGSLDADGLSFNHPVYRHIADLYRENFSKSGFTARRFFLSHPDDTVSLTAASLMEDRYQISTIYKDAKNLVDEDRLLDLTTHVMAEYQLAVVKYEIRQLEKKIQNPGTESLADIQKQYLQLLDARNALARKLGDQVVSL